VERFLEGWRPDAGVFAESELWPNLIGAAARRGVPLALIQGRMSARSFALWRRLGRSARAVLAPFRLVLAQTGQDAARFTALGAPAECWGNLKYAAPPLPVDAAELRRIGALLGGRPLLLAASTHPGEEAAALEVHRALAPRFPGLLTAIVPRHPERGAAIAALAGDLPLARRSRGEDPTAATAIWLGDTLGELGLFYRLAQAAFIGGSLVPHGGQNPLEPARLGCPILLGPHTQNFAEIVGRLHAAGAARHVADAAALAPAAAAVLSDERAARAMVVAAARIADGEAGLPARIAEAIEALLPAPLAGAAVWRETA
jgi:3-deoxy-D-manno-octulosonic-acid transferase